VFAKYRTILVARLASVRWASIHSDPDKNEQQTISHAHVQVQKMFEAGPGIFAEDICMLAYSALSGHMQMRRDHAPCDRAKGRG
jgi:hypothetical protein